MSVPEAVLSLEQVRRELSVRPLRASSAGRTWDGVSLDHFGSYHVEEMHVAPRDHHVITLALGSSGGVIQDRCGQAFESDCWAGEFTMIPAGFRGRWHGHLPEHLRIAVSTESLEECGVELKATGMPLIELRNGFRVRDVGLQHYGEIFRHELEQYAHPGQELIMSSLSVAFCTHVVRRYTGAAGVEERSSGTLQRSAIRRVIDYLAQSGERRPTLDELAAISGVSRFHFSRMFTKAMGIAPSRYLERLKIEQAKAMIRSGEMPLAQIALAVGFADQSHFTRRFRHWVGCTPAVYGREYSRKTVGARR